MVAPWNNLLRQARLAGKADLFTGSPINLHPFLGERAFIRKSLGDYCPGLRVVAVRSAYLQAHEEIDTLFMQL